MAGVMAPSPKNRQAPAMPTSAAARRLLSSARWRCARAVSAMMPPSPRLWARRISSTYFTVTTRTSDQRIRDRMPSTSPRSMPSAAKCSSEAFSA